MSQKLSRILVGVDFSEPSLNALSTAASLALKEKAVLHLLNAQESVYEQIVLQKPLPANPSNNSSILSAMAADISRKTGIKTKVLEPEGHAAEAILRATVELGIDLLVIGTYGASGHRYGHTGCTAYTISKYAPCPLLLVPSDKLWTSFRKPLMPVRPVLTAMRHYSLLRCFIEKESTLRILGLARPGEPQDREQIDEALSQITDSLSEDKVTTSIGWNSGNAVAQNVLNEADQERSDLLVLTTAIDVSNKQFFLGPISHHIIHNARIPVLVINKVNSHTLVKN